MLEKPDSPQVPMELLERVEDYFFIGKNDRKISWFFQSSKIEKNLVIHSFEPFHIRQISYATR